MLSLARAALVALVLTAVGQQFLLHIVASYSKVNFFSYFTNLSNLFAALVLLMSIVHRSRRSASLDTWRFISSVNMAVVGITFVALLRDVDLGDLRPWVNVVCHYVMPVAVVADWFLEPPVERLGTRRAAMALLFPALYFLYVMVRGQNTGWYPYPFLNPANVGGYAGVAMYFAGIFVTFLVVGGVLLLIPTRRTTR